MNVSSIMKSNKFEIELESKIDKLPVISDFINASLIRCGADASTIHKVQLAVDEACTNIINYAYAPGFGPVKINLESDGAHIIITIRDKGKPFDPTSIPPPDLNPDVDQRKIGGLGFYFIRKLMDGVSYSFDSSEGNKLTLSKEYHPEAQRAYTVIK